MRRPKLHLLRAMFCAVAVLCAPTTSEAQRQLHWQSMHVDATLEESGTLKVVETQTMVFTGDWNGGERRFDIRPRQKLRFISLSRAEGDGWRAMTADGALDDVDDYAFTDASTLRWRSRRPSDPPFSATTLRYQLRYELSGVLIKQEDGFLLDHDFAFPDRDGVIERFTLNLALAPEWTPKAALRDVYATEQLKPGNGFVVTLPLQYSGAGVPAAIDVGPSREIVMAVWWLFGITAVAVLWLFVREQSLGRFAPLPASVDEAWLREHLLEYPAEIVGAAWDESIGAPEVVALIARMVTEGKLESEVNSGASMALRLKVDRNSLSGHERTLVDRLFFNGRIKTNTDLVKQHYRSKGFNPADEIRPELKASVDAALPGGRPPRKFTFISALLWWIALGLLLTEWYDGQLDGIVVAVISIGAAILCGIAAGVGSQFRTNIHWGHGAAVATLAPVWLTVAGVALFLWFYAGAGLVELSPMVVLAFVVFTLSVVFAATDAMKSRQHRAAIAFRKALAAGRAFFISELGKDEPRLRDEWFPWILAFGLGKRMDDWSARQSTLRESGRQWSNATTSTSTSDLSTSDRWTGFGAGRSGGGGGGASWTTAASGLAAGVSPPSSSSSSGGGSSSSSSSSGSSGGGGGGGW